MNRFVVPFAVMLSMVAGCFFSPWENLTYEACNGAPLNHAVAERYIRTHSREHRHKNSLGDYVAGDAIVSVMVNPSGYSGSYKGPYKMWIRACKRGVSTFHVVIKRLIVRREGDEHPMFCRKDIIFNMGKVEMEPTPLLFDECTFQLPHVLNPQDGKRICVELSVAYGDKQDDLQSCGFVYEFSPRVQRGWFQCLN